MRKEAYPFLALGLVLAGAGGWFCAALAAPGVLFAAFCAYFFRDPDRTPPADPALILSPGDGKVMTVSKEGPGAITTVRIFLSVFDVHVQRLPVSGTVEKVHYQPGAFHMAMVKEAMENERSVVTVRVEGRSEALVFEQIAGFVARRIHTWLKVGDKAVRGERYGLIQFGSQAAVHLPESAEALVKPGDRVTAGLTPIARWR